MTVTEADRRLLAVLERYIEQRGFSPSLKDLADVLGISRAAVRNRLARLKAHGFIYIDPKVARSIRLASNAVRNAMPEQDFKP